MIKKFENFTSEQKGELSEDKIDEIMNILKGSSELINLEKGKLDELVKDLEVFISEENKNDQIDDSYISIKEVNGLFSESIKKMDEINSKMLDYSTNGRQYLY